MKLTPRLATLIAGVLLLLAGGAAVLLSPTLAHRPEPEAAGWGPRYVKGGGVMVYVSPADHVEGAGQDRPTRCSLHLPDGTERGQTFTPESSWPNAPQLSGRRHLGTFTEVAPGEYRVTCEGYRRVFITGEPEGDFWGEAATGTGHLLAAGIRTLAWAAVGLALATAGLVTTIVGVVLCLRARDPATRAAAGRAPAALP